MNRVTIYTHDYHGQHGWTVSWHDALHTHQQRVFFLIYEQAVGMRNVIKDGGDTTEYLQRIWNIIENPHTRH